MIRSTPFFSIATLLCLIALYLQLSWRLPATELTVPGRWLLGLACQPPQCQLPSSHKGEWHIEQLSVTPHEEYYNLLDVKVSLVAEGPYPPAVPALGLNFTDLSAKVIAARRFTVPDDPRQRRIELHWQVVKPGQNAQGHQLELLSAS